MKHFKTFLCIVMTVLMLFSAVACSSPAEPAPAPAEEVVEAPAEEAAESAASDSFLPEGYVVEDIMLSSGPSGGNWNAMGASFSEALMRAGGKAAYMVGGGTQNVIAVGDGAATLAFCNQFALLAAYNGDEPYTRQYTDVVALMALETNPLYFLVPADSGIKTLDDLKGKTVALSAVGTTSHTFTMDLFKVAGIDPDKDMDVRSGSMSEGADMMKDRLVDAYLVTTGTSNSTIMDICTSLDVEILSFDDAVMDALIATNSGYRKLTMPAGSYAGQDEDVHTITSDNSLICSASMSEEDAYWITKAIVENFDYIVTANAWMDGIDAEHMSNTCIDMHPGAKRYFDEILG